MVTLQCAQAVCTHDYVDGFLYIFVLLYMFFVVAITELLIRHLASE